MGKHLRRSCQRLRIIRLSTRNRTLFMIFSRFEYIMVIQVRLFEIAS